MAVKFPLDQPLRVLLVDDDDVDRMAIKRALTKAGFDLDCTEASNAETATALSREGKFDLAFLDYFLPDQNGLSLLKQLRGNGMMSPIIMLTGQSNEQTVVDLMRAGAADYLNKADVTAERLKRRVHSVLRVYNAELAARQAAMKLEVTNALLLKRNQELEQNRRKIEAQNRQLLEAAKLKSEFVATISHELRTPMNSILGFSQVLTRQSHGKLSSYQLNMVQRILTNAEHLMSLISDLLDFSKAEAGRIELQYCDLDLSQLVAGIVLDMDKPAKDKGLDLTLDDQLQAPILSGDSTRIRQIMVNLLCNAIKFTHEGGIQVSLRELQRDNHQDWVEIQVSDSGIGIAPEAQSLIFDTFRQVNQSDTRDEGGTGLGLAIVQALVTLMQGKIEVESEIGEGARFTVTLPKRPDQ